MAESKSGNGHHDADPGDLVEVYERIPGAEPVRPAGPLDQELPGDDQPVFFFDLGSPYAWLVAEGMSHTMPTAVWVPVCQADLSDEPLWDGDRDRVESLAAAAGLLPPRWPAELRPDTREAMLVATFCKSIGRAASFALAAFRQTWNGGRDLADRDTLLIAAAACELHPRAILQALELESTRAQLAAAAEQARTAGVKAVPAVRRESRLLGPDELLMPTA